MTRSSILSAGVVVVRRADDGWRVLLLRVYNYWDCPKGLVEPGEDPLTTARREVREETTIDDLDFALGRIVHRDRAVRPREQGGALLSSRAPNTEAISLPVNAELGKPEHHELRWCRLRERRTSSCNDRLLEGAALGAGPDRLKPRARAVRRAGNPRL